MNRLTREVVDALSLEVFRVGGALSNLIYWKCPYCLQRSGTRGPLKVI